MRFAAALIGTVALVLMSVAPARATHFKGGTASWEKDLFFSSPTTQRITVTLDTYWRWSFASFGFPAVGATVLTGTPMTLSGSAGYSFSSNGSGVVVSVNQTEDWMVVRSTITQDIPNTAFPVSATLSSGTRPSNLRETNNDQNFRLGTLIDTTLTSRSAQYTGSAEFTLGVNQPVSFQLQARGFNNLANTAIIAPSADSSLPQARPMGIAACASGCSNCYGSNAGNCVDGLTVSSTGLVSWTPQVAGVYAVQFRITSVDFNNSPKAAIPVDVLLTVQNTAVPTFTATPTNTGVPPAATFTPTATPTDTPTFTPTFPPTNTPTLAPTDTPTSAPTSTPTTIPTDTATAVPTATPTDTPTASPTITATQAASPTITATPSSTPVIGFVPPDAATAKCEKSVAAQRGKFFACTTACKAKQASAALDGQTFDLTACEQGIEKSCRAAYDAKSAKLLAKLPALCPPCLDASAQADLAVLVASFLQSNNGLIYCAGTTGFGSGNSGFVPPDANTAKCAKAVAKNLGKLSACVSKCEIKRATAALKVTGFDTSACKQSTCRAKYDSSAAKLLGSTPAICPACLNATAQSHLADLIVGLTEDNSARVYCAGTVPLP